MTGSVKLFDWDRPLAANAAEISAGGVFLRTSEALPEGSMVTLRLTIPGMKGAFTALGKVVRTVKGGWLKPGGMGIRFVDISSSAREAIGAYVEARGLKLA